VLKLITIAACVLAVAVGIAWAGDMTSPQGKMTSDQMQAMKASMLKCSVCKHMAAHLDELGPVMTMEVAKLNDGVAVMHNITDPAKIAVFRAAGKETSAAGMACMAMTDEQAKAELCEFCQRSLRGVFGRCRELFRGKAPPEARDLAGHQMLQQSRLDAARGPS